MSAFIAMAGKDRIEVACDGALYDGAGRLWGVKKKAIALPEVPAAIWGRGAEAIVGDLAHFVAITSPAYTIAGSNTYDDLVARIENEIAPRFRKTVEAAGGLPPEAASEIVVAGFSDRLGPCVAVMRTFETVTKTERFAPWRFFTAPPFWAAGPDIREEIEANGPTWEELCREGLRPHALGLMEAMRRRKDVNPLTPDAEPIHGVGGHVQFVEITRDDARSEILCDWHDPIGEMIDPFRVAA